LPWLVLIGPVRPQRGVLFSLFRIESFPPGWVSGNTPIRTRRTLMPTSTEPDTGAIHRVLLDSGADPKLIHPAIEEIRHLSGQNVIAAIGAQITELRSETQAQFTELRAEMNTLNTATQAQFTGLRAEMNTLNKVIWPLISLLAIPMFALLYKILMQ
jgi:hypothetical protein